MKKVLQNKYFQLILILVISSIVIFYNLGKAPVFDWDEARYAVNALEFLKNGDWIVMHYENAPDLYNVRPPLGAWLIALSFKIFGLNEFALRFWSAAFAILTIGLVYLFGISFADKKTAFFSAIILLSTSQYINFGVARTADYNAGIIFFITLTNFLFLLSIKYRKKKYLLLAAAALALGFLYKSIMGLIPLFLIIIFLLASRKNKNFSYKDYVYPILIFLGITLPWTVARYLAGKEFFEAMFKFDFYERLAHGVENNTAGLNYYFYIIYRGFSPWYILFIFALFLAIYFSYKKRSNLHLYLLIWFVVILLAMTIFQTKLPHYIVLAYPAAALMIGSLFSWLFTIAKKKIYWKIIIVFFFSLFFYQGALNVYQVITKQYQPSFFVEEIKKSKNSFTNINNLYTDKILRQSELFYLESVVPGQVLYCNYFDKCSIKSGDGLFVRQSIDQEKLDSDVNLEPVLIHKTFLLYRKK